METIGRYGTGFLTTHLLSPEILISGQLDDSRFFDFRLFREKGSVAELQKSMDQATKDFDASLSSSKIHDLDGFTTRFRYPVTDDADDVVDEGIETLKRCAPYVVVFNKAFSGINIKTPSEEISFKVDERRTIAQGSAREITVTETSNQQSTTRKYLLIEDDRASVCVPFEYNDSSYRCTSISDVPKLFLGFPLIGTENFSFPVVVNSLGFTPTEERDGVLWRGNDKANQDNQAIIEEACELAIELIEFATSKAWNDIHVLATIPPIQQQNWLNTESLKEFLDQRFIDQIRRSSIILCENARTFPKDEVTKYAIIPYAEKEEDVLSLWDLLNEVQDFRQKLPRRNEATGWRNAVKSWIPISMHTDGDASFSEKFDCRDLALHIEKEAKGPGGGYGTLERLQHMLRESDEDSTINWLDQLYEVLKSSSYGDLLKERNLVPDQDGFLHILDELYRDEDVDNELKDIAEILDINVRRKLRDTRLTSLESEQGRGDYENSNLIQEIKAELWKLADKSGLNDGFAKASTRLFAWIVRNEEWNYIRDFPAFSEAPDESDRRIIALGVNTENKDEIPLSPARAWIDGLSEYFNLFPPVHIMADAFFDKLSDPEAWTNLEEKGFVRSNVVFTQKVNLDRFILDESLSEDQEHKTIETVQITDITFFDESKTGTIGRVRRNQTRARLLWKFLTQWLVNHDPDGLEKKESDCECEERHHYFPAKWIEPLVDRPWVPLGSRSVPVTAQSLANLIRDSDWDRNLIREDPLVTKLLRAMRVGTRDLTMELLIHGDEEAREKLDATLTDILVSTDGDLKPVQDFVTDLKDDPKLLEHLEERRERIRVVKENQELGNRVEELVRESIESEGFTVKRTGKGSDFEIRRDTDDDVMTLEVSRNEQSWLVEVKATRNLNVRMSRVQISEAVDKGNHFLLCVVPVEKEGSLLEIDDVRYEMRFVQNIGPRLEAFSDNLKSLEEFREEVIEESDADLELEIQQGSASVRVKHSLWNEGFQIDNLASNLTNTNP